MVHSVEHQKSLVLARQSVANVFDFSVESLWQTGHVVPHRISLLKLLLEDLLPSGRTHVFRLSLRRPQRTVKGFEYYALQRE